MSKLPSEQILGINSVLDHRWRPPLRCDHGVIVQVPPHVVGQELRSAVDLPRSDELERVVVDQRDAARTVIAVGATKADMNTPPGPQCTVCGREYPALAASSLASI